MDKLAGARVFTVGDALSYFWQIAVREGDQSKLAFKTRNGTFKPLMMPFGIKNGPATAQRLSNSMFLDMDFVLVYMDDILIFSGSEEDHKKHLDAFFKRLQEHQVYLKLSKCQFFLKQVKWLGFIIDEEGIRVDQEKVEVVRKFEPPKTVTDVRSFLRLVNFYK